MAMQFGNKVDRDKVSGQDHGVETQVPYLSFFEGGSVAAQARDRVSSSKIQGSRTNWRYDDRFGADLCGHQ